MTARESGPRGSSGRGPDRSMRVAVRRYGRAAVLAGAVLGFLVLLLAPASPASAHARLQSSTPASGTVVQAAPAELVLEFTEPVRLVPDKIRVISPEGERADVGEPEVSGGRVTVTLRPGAPNGTYLVSYRVISADSHPVAGGFTYSVGAPSATAPKLADADQVDPLVRTAIPVAKYVGYAGLLLVVGPALVLAALWPRRLSRRGPTRLAWAGMAMVAASTGAALLLQAPYTTGAPLTDLTGADLRQVFGSPFGTALIVRLVLLAGSVLLLPAMLRGAAGRIDSGLLTALGVGILATWAISGHPAGSPVPAVSVVVDMVHLGSMAVWLGGLVMLVGFLLRRADEEELGAILPVWSRWAAISVTALLLAGVTQALIEVGTPSALVGTTYGRLILAKVGLFALVIAVAAYSRHLVRQRLAAQRPGRIRGAVAVELGITAVVLAVTAVLVQTTPARTAEADEIATTVDQPFGATARSSLYTLQVDVDPADVGRNNVHVYAYTLEGQPHRVLEWRASAALPSAGVEPIDIPLVRLTDDHATGQFLVPAAGTWQLRFTLRTSEIDQATVTVTVPIN